MQVGQKAADVDLRGGSIRFLSGAEELQYVALDRPNQRHGFTVDVNGFRHGFPEVRERLPQRRLRLVVRKIAPE